MPSSGVGGRHTSGSSGEAVCEVISEVTRGLSVRVESKKPAAVGFGSLGCSTHAAHVTACHKVRTHPSKEQFNGRS